MILCKLMSPGKTVAAGTLSLVRAPLPRSMRPAKVHAQVCPLQLPEPGHFRVIIKGQRLQQSRWQLTQARQERLARGGILFSTLAGSGKLLLRSLQLSSAPCPGGTDHIRLPVPKAGSVGNRQWPPGFIDTPGKQAPALPPAASAGAAQMAIAGITRLCGSVNPAGDALPLMRIPAPAG